MSEVLRFNNNQFNPQEEEELVRDQYNDVGLNVNLRWEIYEFGRKPFDFVNDVYKKAGIPSDASLLDVGCNDGLVLAGIRETGHKGSLVGLDVNETPLISGNFRENKDVSTIQFICGSAEEMPFDDNSFDSATALFMLYHVDRDVALAELQRVVKPGGKIIISTSGENNKMVHRKFEECIANELNVCPPKKFNSKFSTNNAPLIISKYFSMVDIVNYQTDMVIDNKDKAIAYQLSMYSMRTAFKPEPDISLYSKAISKLGAGITNHIQNSPSHEFIDCIDRTYYIVSNTKK